jgi:indolepyruvate ferredoxin oxidoreductase
LRRRGGGVEAAHIDALTARLPDPQIPETGRAYSLLVGGVGGTGVVTIGAVLSMAAHLEGKGASVLDFMGFAQKGGTVLSYVRFAPSPALLNQVRIDAGMADAAILCDLVVGTDARALAVMRKGGTRAVANLDVQPTADFIRDRNVDFAARARLKTLAAACGADAVRGVDAGAIVDRLMGDLVFTNMFLLGFAWQQGLAPVAFPALRRAIELNGVAVAKNLKAFALGRAAAVDLPAVREAAGLTASAGPEPDPALDQIVAHRAAHLKDYQNARYAAAYRGFVADVAGKSRAADPQQRFARAVAKNLFKLMAYKDEYEVARLYADGRFRARLAAEFEGDFRLQFHLAPPVLSAGTDALGRPRKSAFGPFMAPAFSVLRRLKFLRGTPFDPFGMSAERRLERRLIADYRALVARIAGAVTRESLDAAVALASVPDDIRGFGPVKLAAILKAEEKTAELMARFAAPQAVAQVA